MNCQYLNVAQPNANATALYWYHLPAIETDKSLTVRQSHNHSIETGNGDFSRWDLRVVQTQAVLFLNQCRKEADPTQNDFEFKWLESSHLIFSRFWVDVQIQFQSRSVPDPRLSDIDLKIK